MMGEFVNAIFRANSSYELVLLDRLSYADRLLIGSLEDTDDLYGVLRSRQGSALQLRSVSRDMALLLLTLREPGPIPSYLRADLGADFGNAVAKLVLDEVLEIENAGTFVTGAAARNLLFGNATERKCGHIAALSIEALQYGQELDGLTTQELAMRLYFYGRKPVSALWRRGLRSEETIRQYLGQTGGGTARAVLIKNWIEAPIQEDRPYWRMWHPRHGASGAMAARYKLYISSDLASLPDVFQAVAASLASAPGVRGFKVARDAYSLSRPDNLVAYFSRLEDLSSSAARLASQLAGCRGQGVPFTAEVTRDGLMSWGIDPPEHRFRRAGSWRLWVADRLAEYLLAAKTAGDAEPWRFALNRLSADGIDTDTWIPTGLFWSRSMATA
jgi:hypothetical protein